MNSLFNQRLQSHFTQMSKYLRYVFNDFFVIALMFIIGGIGYQYAMFIKHLQSGKWWEQLVLVVVLLVVMQLNNLVTFVKRADFIFWLPKEKEFFAFLRSGLRYSKTLAVIVQIVAWFVMIPFIEKAMVTTNISLILMFLVILVVLKMMILNFQMIDNYHHNGDLLNNKVFYRVIVPLVVVALATYINVYVGVVIGIMMLILSHLLVAKLKQQSIEWQVVIEKTESHENSLNRFFNMFTDVENMQGAVKRRGYLDPVFKMFNDDVYSVLYSRGIVRDKEISGLLARVSVLGAIIIGAIKLEWMAILIALLFMYLIVFQLIPYFTNFEDNVFTSLYPINFDQQVKSFTDVIGKIMILVVIVLMIGSIFMFNLLGSLMLFLALVIEWILLIKIYVPKKIKKASSNY
ncbi:ABC transporter permease [Apilactobacillus kunkeei]|uniref:ABC transporter permease n=1 Tax=Apilactobacillus nanyangensis TaxID=2799579 RepID=A0ABT0HYQ5_9LACO|nr:ABC transporter permease [Apilactobacillus nanyangensis]MCK8612045.1 ABC transporter permease [Apilactobacillus nanyangensis]TMT02752.1 ABC transporter permease [Apilactobacillus kunkeei]TMT04284.1 ABC transporter permease [Apilactobacillus kunkeei]